MWMAHDYPLKLKHIMPALEILSVRVSRIMSTRNTCSSRITSTKEAVLCFSWQLRLF